MEGRVTSWSPAIGQTLLGTSSGEILTNGKGPLLTIWLEFINLLILFIFLLYF
jgi:hypothetical protein